MSAADKENYSQLALDIFTKHSPKDGRCNKIECSQCGADIQDWYVLIIKKKRFDACF